MINNQSGETTQKRCELVEDNKRFMEESLAIISGKIAPHLIAMRDGPITREANKAQRSQTWNEMRRRNPAFPEVQDHS